MSAWWFCRMCETANKTTAGICEVCDSRLGAISGDVGLKGDLIRRLAAAYRPAVIESTPARAAPHPRRDTAPRATWQQRLQTGAHRLYEECAEVLRTIARALS